MKKVLALLLLTLLLAACEGTKEAEPPLLLAAADESGVRFYPTPALRVGDPSPLGAWTIPGVLDLAARDDGLWLIVEGELRRYQTEGFTVDAIPGEAQALVAQWSLPETCAEGHLRLGDQDVLVICSAEAVYRLHDATLAPVDTAGYTSSPPVAYALYPDPAGTGDLLAVAYARVRGGRFELYAFAEDGTLETVSRYSQDLTTPENPLGFDFALDPITPALYLLAAADTEPPALYLYTDTLGKPQSPEGVRSVSRVTANLGAAVAYGEGFFVLVEGTIYERSIYTNYLAGWVSPDLYLYLASEDRLAIWDVAGPPEPLGTRGIPGIRALTGFSLR